MSRVPAHLRERALGMLQGCMKTADVSLNNYYYIIPFLLVTCLWNLFSLCLLLNLVMFIQIFTR